MKIPMEFNKAIEALKLMHSYDVNAILAGGSVRDLFMKKPIKDFDFFVNVDTMHEGLEHELDRYSDEHDYTFNMRCASRSIASFESIKDNDNHIQDVLQYNFKGITCDIILVDMEPTEYVNRFFDIGLSKAYFTGTQFKLTSDFLADKNNRRFTIMGENMSRLDIQRCKDEYLSRIQPKYPGFKVCIAPHLQHLDK